MLKEVDAKIQKFLTVARNRGAAINTNIAIALANGFSKHSKDESMNDLSLRRSWAQSLFFPMGFVKGIATVGKVEIRDGVKREAKLFYISTILCI